LKERRWTVPRSFDEDGWGEEEATVPCPHCGREIHEDSQRCPSCENYVTEEDAPSGRKPWWLVAGVLACLYVVYRWVTGSG